MFTQNTLNRYNGEIRRSQIQDRIFVLVQKSCQIMVKEYQVAAREYAQSRGEGLNVFPQNMWDFIAVIILSDVKLWNRLHCTDASKALHTSRI